MIVYFPVQEAPYLIMFQLKIRKCLKVIKLKMCKLFQKKIQQMENSSLFQERSICNELNLKTEDLQVDGLLENPIYRRLYNIVVFDTNKSQYQYRKILVRQLYFLLKITPIIKRQLQHTFLQKLQVWYDKNDHKKTKLSSSSLKNIVDDFIINKQTLNNNCQQQNQARPQSGFTCNKNVASFLRPYTAKRPNIPQNRPDSKKSRFGRSTKASTIVQNCTQTIEDFALSIKEQLEMSVDFINKNRTIHPQSQPIYEQLFSIIQKAGTGSKYRKNKEKENQNEILFQRDQQQFLKTRNVENEDIQAENQTIPKEKTQMIDEVEDFCKEFEQSDKCEDDQKYELQEENQFQQDERHQQQLKRKLFTQDQKTDQSKKSPFQGFVHFENEDHSEKFLFQKLNNKYSHITNHKFVNYSKEDHELVRNYLSYSRVKSGMKKQFNRQSESRRLFSAKTRSSTQLDKKIKNPRIQSALQRKDQNTNFFNKLASTNPKDVKVVDMSQIQQSGKHHRTFQSSEPNYNQRRELDNLYRKPIETYKKMNKNSISMAEIRCEGMSFLTKYDCFLTRQKVNPIADVHIEQFNTEALEQIEKIKQKVAGLGKKYVSTDSLMRALYIDSYQEIGSFKQTDNLVISDQTKAPNIQQSDDLFDWRTKNIYFNMFSNGHKKMKKESRKLKKK